jgi:hypothetical protein
VTFSREQLDVCRRFGVEPLVAAPDMKVGLARNIASGLQPINGLRHPPGADATGWYIWAGTDLGQDSGLFEPVHVEHLGVICPAVIPYLALPSGWRFLIAANQEDVWADETLLDPS